MKLRYMVDCVLRHDEHGRSWYEPVGVWIQGPGPGLDIEMFYIERSAPAILARKDEANWVLNRLVDADITILPDDFLQYHKDTQSPYEGGRGPIVETEEFTTPDQCGRSILQKLDNMDLG